MHIGRRQLLAVLGGAAAAAWPLAARAQQGDRVRRIGVLVPYDENEPVVKTYVAAFTKALADLGWTDGRNVRMDVHWAGDNADQNQVFAKELVSVQADVILVNTTPLTARGRSQSYLWVSPTQSAPASLRACPAREGI